MSGTEKFFWALWKVYNNTFLMAAFKMIEIE